jgi:hypothetical protein
MESGNGNGDGDKTRENCSPKRPRVKTSSLPVPVSYVRYLPIDLGRYVRYVHTVACFTIHDSRLFTFGLLRKIRLQRPPRKKARREKSPRNVSATLL